MTLQRLSSPSKSRRETFDLPAILALIATLNVQAATPPARPARAPEPIFEAARQALDTRLFDYPSARFRGVKSAVFVICGEVNSRNRLGAYTGWQSFMIATNDGETTIYLKPDDAIMVDTLCKFESRSDETDRLRHRGR